MMWVFVYLYGACVTAIYLTARLEPRRAGEWIGWAGLTLIWPMLFAYAVYHMVRRIV